MIQLEGNFKVEDFNFEFVNPKMELNLETVKPNLMASTYDIEVSLHIDTAPNGSKCKLYSVPVEGIQVIKFEFDLNNPQHGKNVADAVVAKFKELYKVKSDGNS
jgi:hypothetical protein